MWEFDYILGFCSGICWLEVPKHIRDKISDHLVYFCFKIKKGREVPALGVICMLLECRDGESGPGPGLPEVQSEWAFNQH